MRYFLILGVLACTGAAHAQSAYPPPGATSCTGCHGRLGSSGLPSLSTMNADAIAGAMIAFKSGERPSTLMGRIAKGFSDEESKAIALWLAAQGDGK